MKANWHGGFGPEISEEEKHNKNNAFSKKHKLLIWRNKIRWSRHLGN